MHMSRLHGLPRLHAAWLIAVVGLAASTAKGEALPADQVEFFEKKIRPVLVAHCYECHSAESAARKKLKGGLLVDRAAGLRMGGDTGPAVVPGKAKESLLLSALRWEKDLEMPPKQKLPAEVIADFEKWIEMGAPDPRQDDPSAAPAKRVVDAAMVSEGKKQWPFTRLIEVAPPAVKNTAWAQTPIDRFILAKLELKGIAPSAAASKVKLVRRAYYDLWGLPPTPAEVDAFVNDKSPQAYALLIDRLLASDRYGERWARHWLDVVRFAESGGYEFDNNRNGAFHYRDFVIKALNEDMPYDQFIRLQLAGDLMKPGDFWSTAASGYLVAGPYPGQTTAKTLEIIRYDHLDDMISTVGSSMLGLSLACVRCHAHKYDPIAQEDYYKLIAALAKTDSAEAKVDPKPDVYQKAKAEFDAAHAPLVAAAEKFEREQLPGKVAQWFAKAAKPGPETWLVLDMKSGDAKAFKKLDDGSLLAEGKPGKAEVYTFVAQTHQRGIAAIRVEGLADPSLPMSGPGRGADGGFVLTDLAVTATPVKPDAKRKAAPVKLKPIAATSETEAGKLAAAVDGDAKTGWTVAGGTPGTPAAPGTPAVPVIHGKSAAAVFHTEGEVGFEGGTNLTITLKFERESKAMGRPRIAIALASNAALDGASQPQRDAELLAVLEPSKGVLDADNRAAALKWFRGIDAATNDVFAVVDTHTAKTPQPALLPVFAASERGGGAVHFLIRGEIGRKGPAAQPGYIAVLMQPADETRWLPRDDKGKTTLHPRIALANWMTDAHDGAGNLLARVIVNRLWQHHLGRGIVATPNDFGVQGEPATHPELLDYLAGQLVRGGWTLKAIHKQIMLSSVYTQGGEPNEAGLKHDPANKLWWRRPARRLEAEAVRDAVLAVGGTLDLSLYGDGTLDEKNNRRSVYLKVKRSQLVPMLQIYDAPEAIQSIGARSSTTVATQSLAMMNSPFVRSRAVAFANRIKPAAPDQLGAAIDQAYHTALSRAPTAGERERLIAFVTRQAESYGGPAKNGLDLALADVCQSLMCSNEFVYID